MFNECRERFYESLIKSVKDRKKTLKLTRDEILPDPKRVTKILNNIRDTSYPYLIGTAEYPRLKCLFECKDKEHFINENALTAEELKIKFGNNYDKMLWGHIDWDKMLQGVITELSKSDISEGMGMVFEDTLVDYVPYAVVRYDELPLDYAKIFIFPGERRAKRQEAIKWVYLKHEDGLFKEAFLEWFSGKTLRDFDKEFDKFVEEYLKKRKPNGQSLGLQAYDFHKSMSKIAIHWQSLDEVKYGDMSEKKSDLQTLYEEYINYNREQMRTLEKFQQKFDAINLNIN